MSYESFTLKDNGECLKRDYDCDELDFNDDDDIVNTTSFEKNTYEYNLKNKLINRYKKDKDDLDTISRMENSVNSSTFINREKYYLNDDNADLKARIRNSLCNSNNNSSGQSNHGNHNGNHSNYNLNYNFNMDAAKRESNLKLEGILHENDYLIQLSKLKRHVIVEIFGGKCFIREYLCTELLKRVKQCCHINYIKQKSGLINYRDCKQLLAENNNIASIEARLNAILVSLPPLTCIILHSSVFLVIKEDLIRDDLIKKLCNVSKKYTNLYKVDTKIMEKRPFEFSALECVFSSTIEHLNAEMKLLSKDFADIKFTLKVTNYQDVLTNLHNLKEPTNILINKVNSFIKAFHEISENNADLKKMELTKCYFNPINGEEDNKESTNQDLQMLLEYFDQELHQIHDQVKHLYELMQNLENKLVSDLSLSRNNLIRMDIVISLINSGFGIGTLITGVFGMNLKIKLEEHEFAFIYVTGLVIFLCLITVVMSVYFFKCIRI
ncbi:CorA-like Mg2+ transporter protein, putative [Plasmodium knowlesi strain H]|uniref:Magnesium transporter n=3 Tax=Plasmodium knowlesi TaxID=5850 RepID=A0A5K1UZV7_PLAKH|nr:CorA-like Mg2+ transporter protein, putative [Plasmodium knowlesi strain H]OTN64106.1 putative CorA-like Mg2+ transporter protein [Plasmodium knowlesi]CAA9990643.1 CorA-like Mg2+ transporter protein, putative [Plasmodium knowlesi strain H]SBO25999.1 CorA-like Mg2+ transporter protein, putative [Plasmodium knowlesi strain H]SBO28715.1 CorA-like Mg2+ transporter protein, putative [Plasmodium knowlesi strain H]VVS80117.1 CorA-like Mg2+ transporter protein, putative [Plasmodium knowlesi strain |eukprot:XP_002261934.1 Mg2+ transporter protein, putative [Plasmodium knowlesi strain H]